MCGYFGRDCRLQALPLAHTTRVRRHPSASKSNTLSRRQQVALARPRPSPLLILLPLELMPEGAHILAHRAARTCRHRPRRLGQGQCWRCWRCCGGAGGAGGVATRRRRGGSGVVEVAGTRTRLYMRVLTMAMLAILTMAHRCEAVRACRPQGAVRESPQAPAAARASPEQQVVSNGSK